jgi:homoserine kinase
MPANTITVRAPATSANLGPGFDCLGLALDLWAEVVVTVADEPMPPPGDPIAQMALKAARRLFAHVREDAPSGLRAECTQSIPIARGLGASAVARAAGLLAANALLGNPLDREELLVLGTELEGHADNMAPTLFGGFQVLVYNPAFEGEQKAGQPSWDSLTALASRLRQDMERLDDPYDQAVTRARGAAIVHVKLDVPDELSAVLFVPDFEMPTHQGRSLLPSMVSRNDAVHNIGRTALLVGALSTGSLELLDVATDDRLHQPPRSKLFEPMSAIFRAAWDAGALCAFLSGGGSTVLALATGRQQLIADAMTAAAATHGVEGRATVTTPTEKGAAVTGVAAWPDTKDFANLYRRLFPRVFAYIYGSLRDTDVARDVATAAFDAAFDTASVNAALLPSGTAVETSVFVAARSLVQQELAKRGTAHRTPKGAAHEPDDSLGSEDVQPELRDEMRRLLACVHRLPPLVQDALSLKYDAELTNAQIATVLGISATDVRVTIAGALRKLRRDLEGSVEHSGQ